MVDKMASRDYAKTSILALYRLVAPHFGKSEWIQAPPLFSPSNCPRQRHKGIAKPPPNPQTEHTQHTRRFLSPQYRQHGTSDLRALWVALGPSKRHTTLAVCIACSGRLRSYSERFFGLELVY